MYHSWETIQVRMEELRHNAERARTAAEVRRRRARPKRRWSFTGSREASR